MAGKVSTDQPRRRPDLEGVLVKVVVVVVVGSANGDAEVDFLASGEGTRRRLLEVVAEHRLHHRPLFMVKALKRDQMKTVEKCVTGILYAVHLIYLKLWVKDVHMFTSLSKITWIIDKKIYKSLLLKIFNH